MRKTYKTLSVILVVLMIFSIMPITSSAYTYSGICGDNVTWTYDRTTETLTISGTGPMGNCEEIFSGGYFGDRISNIVLNEGITTIGYRAFAYTCVLSITIPDSVTTIGDGAFSGCSYLTNVTIGKGVTTIGDFAFESCESLTSITVDCDNQYYSSDEYGVLFNKDKTILLQYPIGNTMTNYTIPNSVTSIVEGAFAGCECLTSITIGEGVKIISNGLFNGCDNLTCISISYGVRTIGANAFQNCRSLTSITIPDSVNLIDSEAFRNCEKLENITIGNNVTAIEKNAFIFCYNLTDVYYNGTEENWNKIAIYTGNDYLINATIHYNCHTHDYETVVTPPTCTQQGYTTYTCECGDSYKVDYTNSTGHKLEWFVLSAASCQTNGVEHGYCENCSYYEVNTTPMTDHADRDDDGYCDTCHEPLGSTEECECNCHKTGISKFFFNLILFFQKLFGSNQVCDCGVSHY